jgi:exodeoxyribonuclease X
MYRVIDIETTGLDPEKDKIVEIAYTDVVDGTIHGTYSQMINPGVPIPHSASAINHITDSDVVDALTIDDIDWDKYKSHLFVAHNAPFDSSFIKRYIGGDWICTKRCAQHVWPDLESYSNQALRYFLGIKVKGDPHRAAFDTVVTANILLRILDEYDGDLVELSNTPVKQKTVRFGQHRGQAWVDVPTDYLRWMKSKGPDGWDEDTWFTVEEELKARK